MNTIKRILINIALAITYPFRVKEVIFYHSDENECDFAVIVWVRSKRQIRLCKKLIKAGIDAWYQAANEDGNYENDYFTKEEIKLFCWAGYAEPSSDLLNRHRIRHEIVNLEYQTLPHKPDFYI